MENQMFTAQSRRNKDLWSSLYITDIPIHTRTNDVYTKIDHFCADVLAEGVNLHRANSILNYDSPWNGTQQKRNNKQ